jgi:hypothetical protein
VVHRVFRHNPVEHTIPVGHSALVVQILPHCGTGEGLGDGVGEGDGVGVIIANDKLQATVMGLLLPELGVCFPER